MIRRLISIFLFLGCFLIAAVVSGHAEQYIVASGCSVSNIGYLAELAAEYEKQTDMKVLVRGGGSAVGLEDLRTGKVDFAASCRGRAADDPEDFEFIPVAWDALVLITHKSNPVGSITPKDAKAIYMGRITNWKQLKGPDTPIKIFISKPTKGLAGVAASKRAMILGGAEPVMTPNTTLCPSTAIVEQMVEQTAGGFATAGFASARKRDVKMLKVNGASPLKDNIVSGKYPLKRPLYLVVNKKASAEVKHFLDFVLSAQGQNFISSLGIPSLADMK